MAARRTACKLEIEKNQKRKDTEIGDAIISHQNWCAHTLDAVRVCIPHAVDDRHSSLHFAFPLGLERAHLLFVLGDLAALARREAKHVLVCLVEQVFGHTDGHRLDVRGHDLKVAKVHLLERVILSLLQVLVCLGNDGVNILSNDARLVGNIKNRILEMM